MCGMVGWRGVGVVGRFGGWVVGGGGDGVGGFFAVGAVVLMGVTGWWRAADGDVVSLTPFRVLETRPGEDTGDGRFELRRTIGAGETVELDVLGRGGVPGSGVGSVVLNTTLVSPRGPGFVTVFPCSAAGPPLASSVNSLGPGRDVANEVIVKLGDGDRVCVFAAMETDMVKNVAHRSEADLLFAGGAQMLTPEATADFVAGLPDKPRLVSVLPRHRVPLVNALRPFPGLAIRALAAFEVIGKRARKARGY